MAKRKIYPTAIPALKKIILGRYPSAKSNGNEINLDNPDYWLWMLDQIPIKRSSDARGRWIGSLMTSLRIFGVITMQQGQNIIHEDIWNNHV
jgi:hypothetical protein